MADIKLNYSLFLENQEFQIPKIQETIIAVSKNVADELLIKEKYIVISRVSSKTFNDFLKFWQNKEMIPEIDASNFAEYQQLNQEFGMLTEILSSKQDDPSFNISCLITNSQCDKHSIETSISRNLDQYLDEKYADQMYQIPIQSLYNIFYNKERILHNYSNAYRFITKTLLSNNNENNQASDLFLLAYSIDGNKLFDESPEYLEDLIHKSIDNGCKIPKFNMTSLFKAIDPVLQNQINELILTNNYKELRNKISNEKITLIDYSHINDQITKIPDLAFFICESIKKFVSPLKLNCIGKYAFFKCSCLTEIFIPETTEIIEKGAFIGCSKLERIKIPKNVKTIPELLFNGCTSLKEINLPNELQSIEFGAFMGCRNLESLIIPDSTNSIGGYSFLRCFSLKTIKLPSKLTDIYHGLFQDCEKIENIDIPDSVVNIWPNAFNGCKSLKKISIPTQKDKKISIKEGVFENCSSLVDVSLPSNLEIIKANTFCNCTKLQNIDIPKTVTIIECCAFRSCSSLVKVELPPNLKYINWATFLDCSSLEHVEFPNIEIGVHEYAFIGCKKLKEVEFSLSINNKENNTLFFNSFDPNTTIKLKNA